MRQRLAAQSAAFNRERDIMDRAVRRELLRQAAELKDVRSVNSAQAIPNFTIETAEGPATFNVETFLTIGQDKARDGWVEALNAAIRSR